MTTQDLSRHPDLPALLAATLGQAPAAQGAVICLCADWCGTCRSFRASFDEAASQWPGWVFRWVDVEDEADALGDVDVQTFPTLIIGGPDGQPRFAGPVLPQPGQIGRLLQRLAEQG